MKVCPWLLAIPILISTFWGSGLPISHAEEYVSLASIREETKAGWHQTYEVNGRTVDVSVEIEAPEVERFPIVQAGLFETLTPPSMEAEVVWVVNGLAMDNMDYSDLKPLKKGEFLDHYSEADTNRKFPPSDPDYALSNYVHGSTHGIAVDAQTGEVYLPILDHKDKPNKLNPGKILTWKDVK